MTLEARTELPANTRAPSLARSFVAAEIGRTPLPGDISVDDLVLVVSELVTNAVKAGSSRVTVVLRTDAYELELSVEDDAAGSPQPRRATPESLGGRGLAIVEHLAHGWSTAPAGGARGKRVSAIWHGAPSSPERQTCS